MLKNKKVGFFRKSSTETIDLIKLNTYPALEKNPLLKEGVLSVLNQLYYLDKINRIEASQANTSRSHSDSFLEIRTQIANAINNLPPNLDSLYSTAKINNDMVTLQNIYSDIVIKVYENWKENNAEQYQQTGVPVHCSEACNLFYGFLRKEGIDSHKMRVVCFQSSKAQNVKHNLIIYAENESLLKSIESVGLVEKSSKDDSCQNLLEILAQRNKEEAVLLIDPWSRDNKIIDLEVKDRIYKDYFPELRENIRQKLLMKIVMDSLLIESGVTSLEEGTASCSSSSEATRVLKS